MTKKLTQFAVFVLAILTADLLYAYAFEYFKGHLHGFSVYQVVLISMTARVLLFYPIFKLLGEYVKTASEKYVKGTKKITGNRFFSLLIGFTFALTLLFLGFLQIWYHRNGLLDFKDWLLKQF